MNKIVSQALRRALPGFRTAESELGHKPLRWNVLISAMPKSLHAALIAALLLAGLLVYGQFVPFHAPSYVFYAGVVLILAGLLSCLRPLRFLLISSRRAGLVVAAVGVGFAAAGALWPTSLTHAAPRAAIDRFMPDYHFTEVHSIRVQASPEAACRAARAVTYSDLKVYRLLMGIRNFAMRRPQAQAPGERPILAGMTRPGGAFVLLSDEPARELVAGGVMHFTPGRPPQMDAAALAAFHQPGWIKVVFNLRFEDEGGGWTRVSTETRILGTDSATTAGFARYWCAVYPGSAILRRMWLQAMAQRLAGGSAASPARTGGAGSALASARPGRG